jgi:hypothetical protein
MDGEGKETIEHSDQMNPQQSRFKENLAEMDKTKGVTEKEASKSAPAQTKRGSLVVIGTGIRTVGELTIEAIA